MPFKKYTFIFRSVLDPQSTKYRVSIQDLLTHTQFPHHEHLTPEWHICYDEPTLMHYYRANSIAYIMLHPLCCAFCGFGYINNNMYNNNHCVASLRLRW